MIGNEVVTENVGGPLEVIAALNIASGKYED